MQIFVVPYGIRAYRQHRALPRVALTEKLLQRRRGVSMIEGLKCALFFPATLVRQSLISYC